MIDILKGVKETLPMDVLLLLHRANLAVVNFFEPLTQIFLLQEQRYTERTDIPYSIKYYSSLLLMYSLSYHLLYLGCFLRLRNMRKNLPILVYARVW